MPLDLQEKRTTQIGKISEGFDKRKTDTSMREPVSVNDVTR